MPTNFTLKELSDAIASLGSAIRITTRLAPVGGDGDKVFPPTYEGGRYAIEQRRVGGRVTDAVLLDSVQSQANRMEQALKARAAEVGLPHFRVAIRRADETTTTVTSLDAPHRVWDAISRDSLWDGQPFRASPVGKRMVQSAPDEDAAAFYEYAPTALLFGMWDSTGGEGGVGKVRWARAVVSEVVGLDVVRGRKTSSRIDPLGITADAAVIYRSNTDGWTLDEKAAVREKNKPVPFGKESKAGKPSAINHGNITPTIGKKGDEENAGGVAISEALQLTVLSLPQLRRLRFPTAGKGGDVKTGENAGRTALAALALYAFAAAYEGGYWFRSRCHLVPREAPKWESVGVTAQDVKPFTLTTTEAGQLLANAITVAQSHGLKWATPVDLTPSKKLVELVCRSDEKMREGTADAGD
jgi:CRISPR-associated protein Csb1